MKILGIDTSCDDTGVAIVEDGQTILSNIIASQHEFHETFGGIVPIIAARQHVTNINFVIEESLKSASLTMQDIDAVAVTHHHGLLLSLIVGVSAAKSLAIAHDKPLIGIHHLEGHIYSNFIDNDEIEFPFLCLTVAGGHTLILKIEGHEQYKQIGTTRDDAAGEVYDKLARRMGLGYPGGPVIDKLAEEGNPKAFKFPRPMMHRDNYEFSFSGLKTSVIRTIDRIEAKGDPVPVADICASFQQAVVDVLVKKALKALQDENLKHIALAGGVAMNSLLRNTLTEKADEYGYKLHLPQPRLCMDNGAMVAAAAYYLSQQRGMSEMTIDASSNALLDFIK